MTAIGERPTQGAAAREWDLVGGSLDQHQQAYQRDTIDSTQVDRATEITRHYKIERVIQPYQRHHALERDVPEIDLGISR